MEPVSPCSKMETEGMRGGVERACLVMVLLFKVETAYVNTVVTKDQEGQRM